MHPLFVAAKEFFRDDYNNFVTAQANTEPALVSLMTTWKAIGSTAAVSARDNTGTNPSSSVGVPIYTLDGVRIANNNADLWDGALASQLWLNQHGVLVTPIPDVWTGTDANGLGLLSLSLGHATPVFGKPFMLGSGWVAAGTAFASGLMPLYGISDILPVTAVPEVSSFVCLSFLVGLGLTVTAFCRMVAFGFNR